MEKSNPNFFDTIREKLFGDVQLLALARLSIAKTLFIIFAFAYFFTYLLVIGGFQVEVCNTILFFLFPLFAFATTALLYNIIRYIITIYAEKLLPVLPIIFIILALGYLWLIATKTGLTLSVIRPYLSKISSFF